MEELLYDWFGLNEWLFSILYMLNFAALDSIWHIGSYAYSYWVVTGMIAAICFQYMRIRHTATDQQLESMSRFLVSLIAAFTVVWCTTYTLQNITAMPRPWTVLPDMVSVQSTFLSHEGLPASAPAISIMLACLAWKHVGSIARLWLTIYAGAGCLLSVVSGVNWPVEVAAGAALGWISAKIGQTYFSHARRISITQ